MKTSEKFTWECYRCGAGETREVEHEEFEMSDPMRTRLPSGWLRTTIGWAVRDFCPGCASRKFYPVFLEVFEARRQRGVVPGAV